MLRTELVGLNSLEKAAELLKKGELVAFPTETVYGLGASIFNVVAIRKIFAAKKRPADNPLIAHIASLKDLEHIAVDIPDDFYRLAEVFFPGPLTVLLPKHSSVPIEASAGLSTIGVRMPAHNVARQLIALVGEPLVAPSANLSGKPSSTHHEHVFEDFEGKIAAVVEGGQCLIGLESTVISLQDPARPLILRPGEITPLQLQEILKKKVVISPLLQGFSSTASSPGMKYRHYAPKAPIKIFYSEKELLVYLKHTPLVNKILLVSEKQKANFSLWEPYILSNKNFYSILRLSDKKGYEEILVLCDQEDQQNAALMNRLSKAASLC